MLPSSLSFVFFFSSDDHSVSFQQGRATISPVHAGGLAHSKWSCGLQSRLNRSTLRTAFLPVARRTSTRDVLVSAAPRMRGRRASDSPARSDPRLDVLVMVDDAGEHRELGRLLSPNRRSLPLSGISCVPCPGHPVLACCPSPPILLGRCGGLALDVSYHVPIQETSSARHPASKE
jgi:hypothetical protein